MQMVKKIKPLRLLFKCIPYINNSNVYDFIINISLADFQSYNFKVFPGNEKNHKINFEEKYQELRNCVPTYL